MCSSQVVPVNFGLHAHLNPPGVGVHVPELAHGLVLQSTIFLSHKAPTCVVSQEQLKPLLSLRHVPPF